MSMDKQVYIEHILIITSNKISRLHQMSHNIDYSLNPVDNSLKKEYSPNRLQHQNYHSAKLLSF